MSIWHQTKVIITRASNRGVYTPEELQWMRENREIEWSCLGIHI